MPPLALGSLPRCRIFSSGTQPTGSCRHVSSPISNEGRRVSDATRPPRPAPRTPPAVASEARQHATSRVPLAQPDELAADVRSATVGAAYACADDVAVLADGVLVGIVPIERLLAAGKRDRIAQLMDADPPVVAPGTDPE